MMRCTQNKFSVFFIGPTLLGRVGSSQENLESGWDGSQKVTHVQLWTLTNPRADRRLLYAVEPC